VDTLGFVALFGLFTAHVTGNFVLIGSELARPSGNSVLIKFLAFGAFVAAVAFTRLYILSLERRGKAPLRSVFSLQLILLIGFMLAGLAAVPLTTSDAPLALLAGAIGAAAMDAYHGDDGQCHPAGDRSGGRGARRSGPVRSPPLRQIPVADTGLRRWRHRRRICLHLRGILWFAAGYRAAGLARLGRPAAISLGRARAAKLVLTAFNIS
jgi:hypothetical protein